MLEKEVTRKQFIVSVAAVLGLLMFSGLPKGLVNKISKSKRAVATVPNSYGNQTYGGLSNA